jgi:hypothetical protein
VLALLGLLSTMPTLPASAQQSADQVVLDLNHGAMDAYNNMDINRAGSMLEQALQIAMQNGVARPLLAQTNMNLAVVYVGGLGDNDGGVRYFADALCADPNAQLDPLTSTPDIQSVFQVAVAKVQQQGCAGVQNVAPGAAAGTVPMQQQPGEQAPPREDGPAVAPSMDDELPPGWAASDTTSGKAKDFRRFFLQFGFALGMPWVKPGMPADREAPHDLVFVHSQNGGKIANPEELIARGEEGFLRFPGARLVEDPNVPLEQDFGITQRNAWEPDQDSFDGYIAPNGAAEPFTSSQCPADGKESGPPFNGGVQRGSGLYPTSYCVRVNKPGFAPHGALRANLGYFITKDVAVSALFRLQLASGQGQFHNMLLGGRVEYMLTKRKARGLMLSAFVGATFGQIQAKPSAQNETGNEPWIKSGLVGAHVGTTIRYRFTDNLGMFMAPELDLQFPSFLWSLDLTMLGGEVAF